MTLDPVPDADLSTLPRTVWMLWLQGWHRAPDIALACRASWEHNANWTVRALDADSLLDVLPADVVDGFLSGDKEPEAISDLVRLELLHRHGGVWADATTVCARPIDEWLPELMSGGFFALAEPGQGRPLSTWFLAAKRGSYVIDRWRRAALEYWQGRARRDHYFWPHRLFATCLEVDPAFREAWSNVPRRSARHPFHFGPGDPALRRSTPADLDNQLAGLPVPVLKLSHKDVMPIHHYSLLDSLLQVARRGTRARKSLARPRRVLLAWYGSIEQHGTLGDLRSLEALAVHLVSRGHHVEHASAGEVDIPDASRVQWAEAVPAEYDAAIFVCGPVLRTHPQTRALFAHLSTTRLAGVGVSLMPEAHPDRANPFEMVLARQGGERIWGDIAILAPSLSSSPPPVEHQLPTIGFSLRGQQGEYGKENCAWREARALLGDMADAATGGRSANYLQIENHLARSGQPPGEIEQLYAKCDLVLTTRFHGAICAMRQGVPFIAVDQIRGGAKVSTLLEGLGWPHVHRIDSCDGGSLQRAAAALMEGQDRGLLLAARDKAIDEARKTLSELDAWLTAL